MTTMRPTSKTSIVKAALGLSEDTLVWKALRAEAKEFRVNHCPASWKTYSMQEKLAHCKSYRESSIYGDLLRKGESEGNPACTWYILQSTRVGSSAPKTTSAIAQGADASETDEDNENQDKSDQQASSYFDPIRDAKSG